jgi:hypothetical protein
METGEWKLENRKRKLEAVEECHSERSEESQQLKVTPHPARDARLSNFQFPISSFHFPVSR